MKKMILTMCLTCAIAGVSFSQFHVGVGGAFLDFEAVGVQGKIMMDLEDLINKPIDGAATFTYYFRQDMTEWAIDFDAHYRFITIGDDIDIAPISGLQIARSSIPFGTLNNASTDYGINIGGHINVPLSSFSIYAQPKVTIGGLGGFVLSAGVMF